MRTLVMIALVAKRAEAIAGPLFRTDDPAPVELHHAEINKIDQQTRSATGRAGSFSGKVDFGCAAEAQSHIALPFAFGQVGGASLQAGLGDMELGLMYRLLDWHDDGWSAAVHPTFDLPTGDAGRGLGNGRAQLLPPLGVQRSSGARNWDPAIARLIKRAPATHDSRFVGLLAQRSFGERLSIGAELFRRTSTAAGKPATAGFNVCAILIVAKDQNLPMSGGRG